ncbi:MAG: hypothetical protein GY796_02270 [Chloroflexi bacterium]|nr:hypothetical protein [Chloroflexota bacterium]
MLSISKKYIVDDIGNPKEVIIHHRVAKYLRRLPKPQKDRLKELLKQLESEPLIEITE